MLENESADQCFLRWKHELKSILRNVTVERFVHTEWIIEAALAQTAAFNAVHEEGVIAEERRIQYLKFWWLHSDISDSSNISDDKMWWGHWTKNITVCPKLDSNRNYKEPLI